MSQLNVFLPWCSLEDKANREQMQNILLKAGMQIIPLQQSPENEIEFMQEAKKAAADADCSLHIIGVNYGKTMDFDTAEKSIHNSKILIEELKNIIKKEHF